MFFQRITKFSLFLKKRKKQQLFWNHLSSPRVPHLEKKHFFFLRLSEAQSTLGASALLLTLQESLSPVCTLSPEHGCKVKAFLHKTYGEKGKRTETGTKESAAMEEWECSLSGASTQHSRTEASIHLTLQQATWIRSRPAWLNSAFQKLSRVKSQTSFPCLLKG